METVIEGKPIQIVVAKDDHTFELDEEALKSIVDRDGIRDKPIAVISVAGAFRKGKSFLLDFFIRYLYSKNSPDWLGPEDRPLRGFSWRGGCERETTGIQAWSQVFPVSTPHGEVNVLLLDTQGAFDSESTVKDCATIFALSTMTSSVQIYNLSGNIQEDDLQHLQLFTEYGRLALEDTGDKPFQKLMFLIRDWSFPYEAQYGLEGGEKILDRRLTVTEKQHEELRTLRKHIRSCFSAISCFLMPHPGLKVATNPHFDGRLSDIEADFKTELKELVPCVLSAENLVVKQIGGNYIRAQDLVYYFKAYMEVYKGDQLPEPKSMLDATAEANNLSAVASAREIYTNQMEAVCGGNQPYMNTQRLEAEHGRIFEQSMQHFYSRKKMGGEDFSVRFKERLEHDIQEQFTQYKTHNEAKNVFKAARTPATLLAVAILAYLLSGILGLVGLYSIANLLNLCMGVTLLTLCTWAYVRYSGDMRDIGKQIDLIAEAIWESGGKKFLRPAYVTIMDAGLQQAAQQATNYTLGSPVVGSQNNGSASNGKLKTS